MKFFTSASFTRGVSPAILLSALFFLGLACTDSSSKIAPSSKAPVQIAFATHPDLPESAGLAAKLAETLPEGIEITILERPGLLNSLDFSAYHVMYLYTDTEDSRVKERFKHSSLPDIFNPAKRCLILVQPHPRNIPFLRGQSDYIMTGRSSFSVMKPEDINWDDEQHLDHEIDQILSVAGDEVKNAWLEYQQ